MYRHRTGPAIAARLDRTTDVDTAPSAVIVEYIAGWVEFGFTAISRLALNLAVCLTLGVLQAATTDTPALESVRVSLPGTNAHAPDASTRRMVERLAQIRTNADPSALSNMNERYAALLRQRLAGQTNRQQRVLMRYQLAIQLLKAGRTEAALTEFQAMEDSLPAAGLALDRQRRVELRMLRATAYLRLGEQENCVRNHSNESCLFPLQPKAFHQSTRGSRGAIPLLLDQLREFPGDPGARWLLNLAHMTLGEYPDKVPAPWGIPAQTFASEFELHRFPDIAGALGLDVDDLAGGCILDDFDSDGFMDIVASAWGLDGQLRYFHNDGNGNFTQRTAEAGLYGLVDGLNIQQTDYNNDGRPDIWILRGAWQRKAGRIPNSLLRNNGNGTFTDVTEEVGLLSFHPTQTSVWFDFDGDGWLDVFIGNESTDPDDPDRCELFRNNRDGTFTESALVSGIHVARYVKGVTCADYDQDGRPDLYLSCLDGPNLLFHNDGPGAAPGRLKFTEVGQKAGVTEPTHSFATWFFDYDNDGWEDLFVSGYSIRNVGDVAADYLGLAHEGELPRLYHNNHDGTFTDESVAAHLNRVCMTMGSNFGDVDNDGWLDFYLGTGDPELSTLVPNRMFRNAGGKRFQEVTTSTGTGHLQKGHGVGFADLDNDGDQDIYAVIGGAFSGDNYRNVLFQNPGNPNHWLKLKLEGTKANRAAIGARLKLSVQSPSGSRDICKTVNSGGSFGSSPLRQELGLGDAIAITVLEIVWPGSGRRQLVRGLELDHGYALREGDNEVAELKLPRITFQPHALHNHPHPVPGQP
ncbi:MAG: CRTAC1 family protein [Pedosphaera sp.]|nr:CRTAC1 family protein [Pedosphaera sp.]